MEDLERYGDYNDTDEIEEDDGGKKKIPVLKILIAVVFAAVLGLLGYRLYLFDYYPKEIRSVLPTDALVAYWEETDGNVDARTQELRFPYDDSKEGNFFCGYLTVIPAIGELQIAVRLNTSSLIALSEKYGTEISAENCRDYLQFRLTDNYGRDYGEAADSVFAEKSMYRYFRLAFDGVAFDGADDGLGAPEWIRLEIFVRGQDEPFSCVLLYENNEAYSAFSPVTVKRSEVIE